MSQDVNLQIIRNAKVELKHTFKGDGLVLIIIVNDRYIHEFSPKSRESRALQTTDIKILEQQFNGGTYVISDEEIIDYRLSNYRGFIQSDVAMANLQEVIGAEKTKTGNYTSPVRGLFAQSRGAKTNGTYLGGEWDHFDLDVKALGVGGEFKNKLLYRYSPFSPNVVTSLEVERLVCENGMVASAPFVTFEVPVIDDWERNLHVVSAQLKPKINDILSDRFEQMSTQRASVASVMKAHELLESRSRDENLSVEDQKELDNMMLIVDAETQLGKFYKDSVFSDKKRAERADSHLTQFDVFNVLTEASTHVGRVADNDADAQRALNKLVFDELKNKKKLSPKVPQSPDSDFKRAFFGKN